MHSTTYNSTYGAFDLRDEVKVGTQRLAKYTYSTDRKYNLQRLDYGNEDSVQYEYDDEERLIKQTYEDGAYVTYTYDNDGELVKVYDSQSGITTTYTYDLSGRTVKVAESGTNHSLTVTYTYDAENNISQQVETVNGTTHTYEYTYDEDNRIIGQTVDDVETIVTYDEDYGRTTGRTVKVGNTTVIQDSYTYKTGANNGASGQVATVTQNGVTYTYNYDDNGNILSINDGTNTTSYVYDKANQLIRENNQAGGYTHTWVYNSAGNITSRTEYAYTTGSLEGVTPTDTVNYTYGNSNWGDLLTAYDGQALSYDAIGNLLSDGEWTYTWKHGRQLATASRNGITWNYTYDANGMRTKKDCGILTFTYVYDGSQLVEMTFYNDLFKFTYGADSTPLTVNYNGTVYYYVTNLQGDVVKIIDTNRNVVAAYSYDAWGKVLSVTGSMASTLGQRNPLRYRGYVYDQETYLYYLQSRYYDPEWGRFINADGLVTTGQGFVGNNMFAYCGNSPVFRTDDSGMRYCAGTTVSNENSADRGISCRWQRYVKLDEPTLLDKWEVSGVKFIPSSSGDGGRIVNSYMINNTFEMTAYAMCLMYESEYASYFSGSIEGFLFEWDVHNIAYQLYTTLGDITNAAKAKSLDVGKTIYADNHGFFTYAMLRVYEMLYPAQAQEDLMKHNMIS